MDSKKSEEIFRTIFEHSRDSIILADSNGRLLEVNQACVKLFGHETNKDFLHAVKSIEDIFENREIYSRLQKLECKEDAVKEFEARILGNKNRKIDALITCSVRMDDDENDVGYVIIIKDILKKDTRASQIERRSNIRLGILLAISNTISSSLDLSVVLDRTIDKVLEILEPASVRIYLLDEKENGLDLVAHKGLSSKFISSPHMRYRAIGDGFPGQVVIAGETTVVDNFKRAEDPYVASFVEEGLQPTVYVPLVSKGKAVGVMAVSSHSMFTFSDYHLELLTSIGNQIGVSVENANLFENLNAAYYELKTAQEQVIRAEKLASLGKLSATIAHEINNPLAAVLTYIKLMIKLVDRGKFNADKMEDISRYLNTMGAETSRCGEIVKNLLAFSRKSTLTIEPQNIEDIIDRTLILIIHDLEMKGLQVVKEIEPDLPPIQCDFKQIQQSFLNLMGNASEAMSQGGTLTLKACHSKKKGFVEVVISDTGCGISKQDLPRIFEPFFTTKEEGKGVGLGLSVVFGIITRHKGTVEVKSKPEKGTTFKVLLPVS